MIDNAILKANLVAHVQAASESASTSILQPTLTSVTRKYIRQAAVVRVDSPFIQHANVREAFISDSKSSRTLPLVGMSASTHEQDSLRANNELEWTKFV